MHDIKPLCQSVISKDLFEYHGLSSELKSNNFYKLRVSGSSLVIVMSLYLDVVIHSYILFDVL